MHARLLASILVRLRILPAILALAAACGGRSLEKEIEKHPARVVPQGASQILYARVGPLRQNPLAAWASEEIGKIDLLQSFTGLAQSLERAGGIDRFALATYGTGQQVKTASAVAVATGQFDEKAFVKKLESDGVPFVEDKYGSTRYLTAGREQGRSYVAFPSPRVLIVATQEQILRRTLDLFSGKAKSLAEDRAFESLLKTWSADSDLWVTGVFPALIEVPAAQRIHSFTFTARTAPNGGAKFDLALHCLSTEAAQANANLLSQLVGEMLSRAIEAGYPLTHLTSVVNASEITVDDAMATYEITVTRRQMADTVKAFREGSQAAPIRIEGLAPTAGAADQSTSPTVAP
jgi:hypothetical protein